MRTKAYPSIWSYSWLLALVLLGQPGYAQSGDTLQVLKSPAWRPWESDTLPATRLRAIRIWDPLDQTGAEYARLHNLGTAARLLVPAIQPNIGFRAGYDAFDPYLLPADSLTYLISPTAFTDLTYTQGPTAEDGLFRGTFAQRFGKGTDLLIEALRIYHLGDYSRLANHHSSLRVGLRYQLPNGRYSIGFLHGNHLIDQEESGGITTDTLLGESFYQDRVNVPVWLSNAENRYREVDYQLGQYLALAGRVDQDSLGRLLLYHRLRWQNRSFLFSDTSPPDDSMYYEELLTDRRGVRQYTGWTTLGNRLEVVASWQRPGGTALRFQGGIAHQLHHVTNEVRNDRINNLLLLAELAGQWRESIDVRAWGQADLGDQAGTWMLRGEVGLTMWQKTRFRAGILLKNQAPDFREEHLAVSQRTVYENTWANRQEQTLYGQLFIPGLRLEAGTRLQLLTNAIVFDDRGLPDQIGATVSLSHLWLRHHLRVGPIHLHNKVSWQISSDERVRFPQWITRHDLFYAGRWFRKTLQVQVGLQARLISDWQPYGYLPIHGVFTLADSPTQPWFPQLDAYLAMERWGFRAFFEFENLGQPLLGWSETTSNGAEIPRVFSTVDGYPHPEAWLRFGVSFRFRG